MLEPMYIYRGRWTPGFPALALVLSEDEARCLVPRALTE